MKRKESAVDYEVQQAAEFLLVLSAAFESGTWEGVLKFARTNDIFERLEPIRCDCCGAPGPVDLLRALHATLHEARERVRQSKPTRGRA
jgi:hypothetical protein